jgi:hypothetical protein
MIVVARDRHAWRDRARSYRIVVDGEPVASIKRGQRVEVPVTEGHHQVLARINWGASAAVDVDLRPGGKVELRCGTGHSQFGPGYLDLSVAAWE